MGLHILLWEDSNDIMDIGIEKLVWTTIFTKCKKIVCY